MDGTVSLVTRPYRAKSHNLKGSYSTKTEQINPDFSSIQIKSKYFSNSEHTKAVYCQKEEVNTRVLT